MVNRLLSLIFFLFFLNSCGQGVRQPNDKTPDATVSSASSTINSNGTVTVAIAGTGFLPGDSVNIHGFSCTDVKIISSVQLTCVLPSSNIPLTSIVITHSGSPAVVAITSAGPNTFTVPAGVTSLQIELWGAGGEGGESDNNGDAGGGGGGAYLKKNSVSVTPGQTLSYAVGAGGVGVHNGNESGTAGGDTSIVALGLVAHGGGGGGGFSGAPGLGGAGGSASGGIQILLE